MTDFLTRLAQRQLGLLPTVQPHLRSLYAPVAEETGLLTTYLVGAHQAAPRVEQPSAGTTQRPRGEEPRSDRAATGAVEAPPTLKQQQRKDQQSVHQDRHALEPEASVESAPVAMQETRQSQGKRPGAAISQDPTPSLAISQAPEIDPIDKGHFKEQPEPKPGRSSLPNTREMEPARTTPSVPLPRLVEQRADAQMPALRAPASLVGAVSSPKQSQESARDVAEPPVQVTIGRIEVTAVTTSPTPKRTAPARKPSMSLEDYLARRRRRER